MTLHTFIQLGVIFNFMTKTIDATKSTVQEPKKNKISMKIRMQKDNQKEPAQCQSVSLTSTQTRSEMVLLTRYSLTPIQDRHQVTHIVVRVEIRHADCTNI